MLRVLSGSRVRWFGAGVLAHFAKAMRRLSIALIVLACCSYAAAWKLGTPFPMSPRRGFAPHPKGCKAGTVHIRCGKAVCRARMSGGSIRLLPLRLPPQLAGDLPGCLRVSLWPVPISIASIKP